MEIVPFIIKISSFVYSEGIRTCYLQVKTLRCYPADHCLPRFIVMWKWGDQKSEMFKVFYCITIFLSS